MYKFENGILTITFPLSPEEKLYNALYDRKVETERKLKPIEAMVYLNDRINKRLARLEKFEEMKAPAPIKFNEKKLIVESITILKEVTDYINNQYAELASVYLEDIKDAEDTILKEQEKK